MSLNLGTVLAHSSRERPEAPVLRLGDRVLSYADLDRGARGIAASLRQRGIEPGDHVALSHDRVVVDVERLDDAGHLAADLHGGDRFERAGGADRVDDVASCQRDGAHGRHELRRPEEIVVGEGGAADADDENDENLLHGALSSRALPTVGPPGPDGHAVPVHRYWTMEIPAPDSDVRCTRSNSTSAFCWSRIARSSVS